MLGASVRHSAHDKGHEEGGSAYAKAGSPHHQITPLLPSALGHSSWPASCPHQPMMLPSQTFTMCPEGLLGQEGARLPHSGNIPRDSLCPWTRRGWSHLNPRPKESKNPRLAGRPLGSAARGWGRAPGQQDSGLRRRAGISRGEICLLLGGRDMVYVGC